MPQNINNNGKPVHIQLALQGGGARFYSLLGAVKALQELEDLNNGASLKITIAKWYTPNGINISAAGINPDVNVPLSDDDKKNLLICDPTKDTQLQKVLDILTK